jgi:hypothetical protein
MRAEHSFLSFQKGSVRIVAINKRSKHTTAVSQFGLRSPMPPAVAASD